METISAIADIEKNIATLDSYRISKIHEEKEFYNGLVQRGICFVAYQRNNETHFAPSRFVGYINNIMERHNANKTKDGRITNPTITQLLNSVCEYNEELEKQFIQFCSSLGITPYKKSRKYWQK